MSYISTLQGEIQYKTEEEYEEAVEQLEEWGYIPKEENIQLNPNTLTITLEKGVYRNLGRNLEVLMKDAESGRVIGISNEFNWHGTVDTPERSEEIGMMEFAEEEGFTNAPDPDDNWDEYVNWKEDVQKVFFSKKLHE